MIKNGIGFLVLVLLLFTSCKKDPVPTAQEQVTKMLTSTEAWQEPIVTVDDVDYSDVYKDFTITFKQSTYTTSGGAPAWAASGTWVFIDEEATLMRFDGSRDVTINSISDDLLELSFQWEENTFVAGRAGSVKGKQKFKLKKKK